MTANDKDERILKMLKENKSYTDIIAELSVSPSRIAVVKKRNVNVLSSRNDALLGNTTTKIQKANEIVKVVEPEIVLQKIPPLPPPPAPIKKIVEPEKKFTPPPSPPPLPPLSKKEVEEVEAIDHIIEVKLSDIKSIAGKPFFPKGSSNVPVESRIIKKYLSFDEKRLYKRDFIALLDDLQGLINEKKITKSSKYTREILHIQNELIKHIRRNKHARGKIDFSLDSSDKFIKTAGGTF